MKKKLLKQLRAVAAKLPAQPLPAIQVGGTVLAHTVYRQYGGVMRDANGNPHRHDNGRPVFKKGPQAVMLVNHVRRIKKAWRRGGLAAVQTYAQPFINAAQAPPTPEPQPAVM